MVNQQSCDKNKNLLDFIKDLTDLRKTQGKIYNIEVIVVIVIMGIMNGYLSFRALEDYAELHKKQFVKIFNLKNKRVPKRDTFRRVFNNLIFEELNYLFKDWVLNNLEFTDYDWYSLDGKAIKHTFPNKSHHFVTLVSVFSHKHKQIISQGKVKHKSNEIPLSQSLLKQFNKNKSIFILDALNTQKRTIETIVKNDNFYVLPVKNNQKTLLKEVKKEINLGIEIDKNISISKNKGRIESREITLYENNFRQETEELNFKDIKRIIKLRRTTFNNKKKKMSQESFYYISSLEASAYEFNKGIRNHWLIESMHWIKDVVLNEDKSCIYNEFASANFSIIRALAINLIRFLGFESIIQGIRLLMGNIKKMWKLLGGDN